MSRPAPTESVLLRGAAGAIDALIDTPAEVRGLAVVCHPHPLYGGANTNKVAHTVARAFRDLGYAVVRPNFRGVGKSEGTHDHGNGETEDILSVIGWAQSRWGSLPLALGGFSFGAYVQCRVACRLADGLTPVERLVLVGMAAGRAADGARQYDTPPLPDKLSSLIVHGELDDTVPLTNVLDWARPQELPVVVVPGADHFFHGKLHLIRNLIAHTWAPL
ncbi:alpha/beta hydrolase [Pseudothauera hydrothermalis]|jgi:alpha/beta superfamily hydrolase|uniref:alpha/beta hydrolase n=1 Tax=Pseudothauera hydrothermalis TaxID=2184083 RepID=UPI000C7B2028|nr:alpha/beta fold hydrolase [Pseudothauera hydrothermalis]AUL98962.1 alpha/beta hydrolase [Rhodocyclaceae bacterium]